MKPEQSSILCRRNPLYVRGPNLGTALMPIKSDGLLSALPPVRRALLAVVAIAVCALAAVLGMGLYWLIA
jgi:hypothetical protein